MSYFYQDRWFGKSKFLTSLTIPVIATLNNIPATLYVGGEDLWTLTASENWILTINGETASSGTGSSSPQMVLITPTALMAGINVSIILTVNESTDTETRNVLTGEDILTTSGLWFDTDPTSPWSASDYTIFDGTPDTFTTITNKGTVASVLDMSAAQTRQPAAGSTTVLGTTRRIAQWLTVDRMASNLAVSHALIKAFHDGTGLDLFIAFQASSPISAANQILFCTNAIVANTVGMHCYIGPTGILQCRVSNGSGVLYANASFGTVISAGVWYLLRIRFSSTAIPVLRLTLVGNDSSFTQTSSIATGVPSAANAANTLNIGASATNTQPMIVDLGLFAAFTTELSASAADCLGDYLGDRWVGV